MIKSQLLLEKDNTLGNHIKHRQLDEPITARRKRGKRVFKKTKYVGQSREITFDSHHLMNQSEHQESAGKRVRASQVDSAEIFDVKSKETAQL